MVRSVWCFIENQSLIILAHHSLRNCEYVSVLMLFIINWQTFSNIIVPPAELSLVIQTQMFTDPNPDYNYKSLGLFLKSLSSYSTLHNKERQFSGVRCLDQTIFWLFWPQKNWSLVKFSIRQTLHVCQCYDSIKFTFFLL